MILTGSRSCLVRFVSTISRTIPAKSLKKLAAMSRPTVKANIKAAAAGKATTKTSAAAKPAKSASAAATAAVAPKPAKAAAVASSLTNSAAAATDAAAKAPKAPKASNTEATAKPRGVSRMSKKAQELIGEGVAVPRRCQSAYMFFSQANFAAMRAAMPGAPVSQLAKAIGELWKKTTPEQQAPYVEMAKADKNRYDDEKAHLVKMGLSPTTFRRRASDKEEGAPRNGLSAYNVFTMAATQCIAGSAPERMTKAAALWGTLSVDDKKVFERLSELDHERTALAKEEFEKLKQAELEEGKAQQAADEKLKERSNYINHLLKLNSSSRDLYELATRAGKSNADMLAALRASATELHAIMIEEPTNQRVVEAVVATSTLLQKAQAGATGTASVLAATLGLGPVAVTPAPAADPVAVTLPQAADPLAVADAGQAASLSPALADAVDARA